MRLCAVLAFLVTSLLLGSPLGARAAPKEPSEQDVRRVTEAAPDRARAIPKEPRKLLVFNLCKGFYHGAIPLGAKAFEIMGRKTGAYEAVSSEDVEMFRPETLGAFDAVVMNNTTGTLFEDVGLRRSLLEFVRSGKGIVGVHAATDCFYDWREYGEMMGAYFHGHPWNEKVGVKLDDPEHALLEAFGGEGFDVADEIYQFKAPYSRDFLRVLLSLDVNRTNMNKGGIRRTDGDFAVTWVRSYGKGRVFYCSLGHRNDIFWNPAILKHYLDGIQFAVGDLEADTTPVPLDPTKIDPYMGEYVGIYEDGEGHAVLAEADVTAGGSGRYRAVLTAPRRLAGGTLCEYVPPKPGAEPIRLELGTAGSLDVGGGVPLDVRTSDDPDGEKGVKYEYYEGDWNKLPNFDDLTPAKTGTADYFDIAVRDRNEHFGFRFKGFVQIPEDGWYTFYTASDDGSRLFIGEKKVVENDGLHGTQKRTGKIELTAGMHPVTVTFFEKGGGEVLQVGFEKAVPPKEKGEDEGVVLTGDLDGVEWKGPITDGKLVATLAPEAEGEEPPAGGPSFTLERITRRSPTELMAPPPGALVLLPYERGQEPSLDEWQNKKWRTLPDGSMQVNGGDNRTVREFGDIWLHVEFMCPFMPGSRGQGRGNSGVYLQDRYEVQVLDSFGVERPAPGDCGGIYQTAPVRYNACLPPGRWQTFDITFRAARFAADGSVERNPVVTVVHNGEVVHQDQEIPKPTGGAAGQNAVVKAPFRLQDHGHPVRYRNIWVVELGGE